MFLLLLCITGLPLIFHHELDELFGYDAKPEMAAPGAAKAGVDQIARVALAHDPGRVLQYISWDKDEPGTVIAFTNSKVDGDPDAATVKALAPTSGQSRSAAHTGHSMGMVSSAGRAGPSYCLHSTMQTEPSGACHHRSATRSSADSGQRVVRSWSS